MTQIVGEELIHSAYRRRSGARVDKFDGGFTWLLFELEVIEEMLTISFPFCVVTSVTLKISN